MITWIYLSGVLVTFFLLIIKIWANNMQEIYNDTGGKCVMIVMSIGSWFSVFWLFFLMNVNCK